MGKNRTGVSKAVRSSQHLRWAVVQTGPRENHREGWRGVRGVNSRDGGVRDMTEWNGV